MTQPIRWGDRGGFLPFSYQAKSEYSEVASAAHEVLAGNKAPCALQLVYWERYEALRKELKIIDAASISDFDFGARDTLKEMKAALRVIHSACSKS